MPRVEASEILCGGGHLTTSYLHVAVQIELVGMRTERHFLGARALDRYPCLDEVLGEDVAAHQEVAVSVERVEDLLERARRLPDGLLGLALELVEVQVHRRRRLDLVDDAVESGHEARGERQVRVA